MDRDSDCPYDAFGWAHSPRGSARMRASISPGPDQVRIGRSGPVDHSLHVLLGCPHPDGERQNPPLVARVIFRVCRNGLHFIGSLMSNVEKRRELWALYIPFSRLSVPGGRLPWRRWGIRCSSTGLRRIRCGPPTSTACLRCQCWESGGNQTRFWKRPSPVSRHSQGQLS
jgi:hypothetical protein